ncbi:hypothetical protein [Cryptosporangium arvum]|uniref:hypothetical protein n=1 Tax=Cryptosporangium arvum TaxID=80871 RepID=UPI0012ED0E90|nr:hypothetical protein [Cryptosporangium arvum]
MSVEALPESIGSFGRSAVPAGRADTTLRIAIAGRRPVRRVVRAARVVLGLTSVVGFAAWPLTDHAPWTLYVAFGSLAAIALGGLTSWPLESYGGWGLRAERARVIGDWLQAVTLGLGCLGPMVALLDPDTSWAVVGGVGGVVGLTLGWLWPPTVWLVLGSGAEARERPRLERYQRLAQRDEIRAQVEREPQRFPVLPPPVVLRPEVDEPVTLTYDEDLDPDEVAEAPLLTVRADRRSIVLSDDEGHRRTLTIGNRTVPDLDGPGGPVASVVVLVAAGLSAPAAEPVFDAGTEAGLKRLVGDVDRVALLDAAGRRVADLPELAWSLRELARLAGAAGVPCVGYRVDEDVLDRAEGSTPTGVTFDLLAAHHPAAPDLLDLTD